MPCALLPVPYLARRWRPLPHCAPYLAFPKPPPRQFQRRRFRLANLPDAPAAPAFWLRRSALLPYGYSHPSAINHLPEIPVFDPAKARSANLRPHRAPPSRPATERGSKAANRLHRRPGFRPHWADFASRLPRPAWPIRSGHSYPVTLPNHPPMPRPMPFHSHASPSHHRPAPHNRHYHAAQTAVPMLRVHRPAVQLPRAPHVPVQPPRFVPLAPRDMPLRFRSMLLLPRCFCFPIPAIHCAAPPRQNLPKWHLPHRREYSRTAFARPIISRDAVRFAPAYFQAPVCALDILRLHDWPHHKRFHTHLRLIPPRPIRPPLQLPPLAHRQKWKHEFQLPLRPSGPVALPHQPMSASPAAHLAARFRFAISSAQSCLQRAWLHHQGFLVPASGGARLRQPPLRYRAIRAGWPAPLTAPCWLVPTQAPLLTRLCAHPPTRFRKRLPHQPLAASANAKTVLPLREFDRKYSYSGWLGVLGVSAGAIGFPNW